MSRHGRTALIVLGSLYIATAIGAAGYTAFASRAIGLLPAFRVTWIVWASVALLISLLPTAHLSALLLLYSLFIPRTPKVRGEELFPALRGPLVLCTLLALLFAVVVGLAEPYAIGRRDDAVYQSRFAAALRAQGERHFAEEHYDRAAGDFARYLRLVGTDEAVRDALLVARSRIEAPVNQIEDAEGSFVRAAFVAEAERQGLNAVELLNRARDAFDRGDFFTAHYFAQIATQLDSQRPEAAQLLNRAMDGIRQWQPTAEEEHARALFVRKRDALAKMSNGSDLGLIEAYHEFASLQREHPSDPDVQRFYPLAREAVQRVAFFVDELRESRLFPMRSGVTFRNGREPATREFIHIEQLILGAGAVFAEGIEVVRFDADGIVQFHARAPYGKVIERGGDDAASWIILRAVDRATRALFVPDAVAGEAEVPHLLQLNLPMERLELVAAQGSSPGDHRLPDLIHQARLLPDFGYPVEPVLVELAMRLLRPFSLLVFSLFAVAFGLRSHYLGRPKLIVVAAGVVLPLMIHYTIPFYLYAYRVVLGFVVLTGGVAAMVAVLVVTQALLMVWALFAMAAQMAAS